MMKRHPLLTGASVVLAAVMSAQSGGSAPAPPGAPPGDAGFLTLVLGPDGDLGAWRAGESSLSPLPASLSHLAGHPINDLAAADVGGNVVVLPAATLKPGRRHNRLEGSAIVISSPTAAAPPAILNEIPFEGDGRRVVVSRDGRYAYVLSFPAVPGTAAGGPHVSLLALDLEEGRVLATTGLDRPPSALALDPSGTRLFLSYAGKIQTYTTRPLAQSWYYRSPGANRGLCFRPEDGVLYSARLDQIASFDAGLIARRKPEERQRLQDDATAVFPVPIAADSLLFSRDGSLLAAFGAGSEIAFVEPASGSVATIPLRDEGTKSVRPFYFGGASGDLLVATFPGGIVRSVEAPASMRKGVAPESPKLSSNQSSISPGQSSPQEGGGPRHEMTQAPPVVTPAPQPSPVATPEPTPGPSPPPVQARDIVTQPGAPPTLSGRLTGQIGVVGGIVIYGPGSIVREQARVAPGADGAWIVPLPSPGTYRIVPVGNGARPLRSEPNFRTLEVRDEGVTGLDFRILGTS